MDSNKKFSQQPSILLHLATFSAFLGSVSLGAVIGWSAPAFTSMENDPVLPLGKDDPIESWIASCICLGALVGGLMGGPVSRMMGRRRALILYGLPLTAGWILICTSRCFAQLIAGRILTGFGAGLVSGTAPTYVNEISTISIRGMLGSNFHLLFVIGILMPFAFGSFISWNYLSIVLLIPRVLMSATMIFMPESPVWLMSRSGKRAAEDSLVRLRGSDSDIEGELKMLEEQADKMARDSQTESFSQMIRRKDVYKPLFLANGLMFFQQFSGINAILFYATDIFKASGSSFSPSLSSIILMTTRVFVSIISGQLIDRLGRKILLIISGVGHVISLGVIGFYYYKNQNSGQTGHVNATTALFFSPNGDAYELFNASSTTMPDATTVSSYGWVPLTSLIVYIIAFSLGYGPIAWMMIPEMTPMAANSLVSSSSTFFCWTLAFVITKEFNELQEAVTKHGTFWIFCVMCLVSIPFVVFLLPETKGRTIEEISRSFRGENEALSRNNIPVGENSDRTTYIL